MIALLVQLNFRQRVGMRIVEYCSTTIAGLLPSAWLDRAPCACVDRIDNKDIRTARPYLFSGGASSKICYQFTIVDGIYYCQSNVYSSLSLYYFPKFK
jgi:hypothetical protein